jgi:tetratricopeptide (TPR) repeat protein
MDDKEITRAFETCFPDVDAYKKAVTDVLELLISVPAPISLSLMGAVLETDVNSLDGPLDALHELVQVEDGYVSFFNPEVIDWLCDANKSGNFTLQGTKYIELAHVLWQAYKDFDNTPFQQEVLEWLSKFIPFTSLWDTSEENASELNNFAHFLSGLGRLEPSVELYFRVLEMAEEIHGKLDQRVAVAQNNLANAFKVFGVYDSAEELLLKSLSISGALDDEQSLQAAHTLSSLGHLFREQGDYEKAKPYFDRSLAIREKLTGPDHPETALALNDYAYLLKDMGEYEKSEPLYRRALSIRQNALGSDHFDTAVTMNNLAILLELKGNYEEPEQLHRGALAIFEKQCGSEHSDTAAALCNLANLLRAKGQFKESESLFLRSIDIFENKLKWEIHKTFCLFNLRHTG